MKMTYDRGDKRTNTGARNRRLIAPLVGLITMGLTAWAAAGDLIVDGNLSVNSNLTVSGTGGITIGPMQISTNSVTLAVQPGDPYQYEPSGGRLTVDSVEAGGDVTLAAGNMPWGSGGDLLLYGGIGEYGGNVSIVSGWSVVSSGAGGNITLQGSGGVGAGGSIGLSAGVGTGWDGIWPGGGGSINLTAGDAYLGDAGSITLKGGTGGPWGSEGENAGHSGSIRLISGGAGNNTNMVAGDIELTAVDGGDVEITGREVRFAGVVRVPAAGDISMGAFTNGPAQ